MNRRWVRNGVGGLGLMLLGGLVMYRAFSLAAQRVRLCEAFFGFEKLFGFNDRSTGAFSVRCTTPTLLLGLAYVLLMIGAFYFAFGFALWNQERLIRSESSSQIR